MTNEIFLQGIFKMWWIWTAIILGLTGTSIVERRGKRARLKTQRISRRSKQMQHKF